MKTPINYLMSCIFFITAISNNTTAQNWEAVGQTMFYPDGETYHIDMAINSSDEPYVAFNDANDIFRAKVMKYNGAEWVAVGNLPTNARNPSIVFNSIDEPYIAYSDWDNSDKATVMKYNGSAWETVGIAGFSAGGSSSPKIAFNNSNEPYVVYADWDNDFKTTVMKFDGTSWITVGTVGISQGSVEYYSIAINNSGEPYVAYSDFDDDYKVTVKKFNGTSWETVGLSGFTDWGVGGLSLAFNNSGELYVAFNEEPKDYKATVMKFNGTDWVTVGDPGFTINVAEKLSLAFYNNQPHISFIEFDSTENNYKTSVMKFDGNQWINVGDPRFSEFETRDTSLVFNSLGDAIVAYIENDGSSQSGPTVMKFSAPLSIQTPNMGSQIMLYPNPAKTTVSFSNLTEGTKLKVYDITGKLVKDYAVTTVSQGQEVRLDISGFTNGIYLVNIENPVSGKTTKKLIVNK